MNIDKLCEIPTPHSQTIRCSKEEEKEQVLLNTIKLLRSEIKELKVKTCKLEKKLQDRHDYNKGRYWM